MLESAQFTVTETKQIDRVVCPIDSCVAGNSRPFRPVAYLKIIYAAPLNPERQRSSQANALYAGNSLCKNQ